MRQRNLWLDADSADVNEDNRNHFGNLLADCYLPMAPGCVDDAVRALYRALKMPMPTVQYADRPMGEVSYGRAVCFGNEHDGNTLFISGRIGTRVLWRNQLRHRHMLTREALTILARRENIIHVAKRKSLASDRDQIVTRECIGRLLESFYAIEVFDRLIVLTRRPHVECYNQRARLHCETGPARVWADGIEEYWLNGHRVPKKLVTAPDRLTVAEILAERNSEIQRLMIERRYEDNQGEFWTSLGADTIHSDETGTLYHIHVLTLPSELRLSMNRSGLVRGIDWIPDHRFGFFGSEGRARWAERLFPLIDDSLDDLLESGHARRKAQSEWNDLPFLSRLFTPEQPFIEQRVEQARTERKLRREAEALERERAEQERRRTHDDGSVLAYVGVTNSTAEPDGTFKRYFLRVPPHLKTARAAVAWTFQKEESDYAPAVET